MAVTRSITRKEKRNVSGRKKSKTSEAPWSNLIQDALVIIMMKLGIGDFLSFSWVCSSWRLCALSNRAKFIACQHPMLISFVINPANYKGCYLQDSEGRMFKTMLPNCIGRICYGVSCGYLSLYRAKTNDFLLVNPITRHELHFPDVPLYRNLMDPKFVRAVLVYSRSMSAWVFLFAYKYWNSVWYSIAGKQTGWKTLYSNLQILDLYAFKGKIYTIHERNILCEMRLTPEPAFSLLNMKNVRKPTFSLLNITNFRKLDRVLPKFVSSDEKLYLLYCMRGDLYEAFELDFDNMKWLPAAKTLSKYAVFISDFMCGAAIKPETWVDPGTQYQRCYCYDNSNTIIGRGFTSKFWYFPHDSLNENLLQE